MPTKKEKERAKRQNERAKELWDTVSCRLPKGTRQRIQAQGLTVNGYINELVLEDLKRREGENASASDVPFID